MGGCQLVESLANHLDSALHHLGGVGLDECHLPGFHRVVVYQVIAQSRTAVVVGEGEHHLSSGQLVLLIELREDPVAHGFGYALKVAGDQHHAVTLLILKRQGFHPQVVQFAIGGPFRTVACQPHIGLRGDDRLCQTGFPGKPRLCLLGCRLIACLT